MTDGLGNVFSIFRHFRRLDFPDCREQYRTMAFFSQRSACSAMVCAAVLLAATGMAHAGLVPMALAPVHAQMTTSIIYSDTADAKEDIRNALIKAKAEHKRVLLDFGGNWCGDCQVLNIYFHDPGNASLLAANYVRVDVNVGRYDKNLDLAKKYGVPLDKGVPALVVLDANGRVVYAQRNGEFEAMRKLDSDVVTAFLQKWKPHARKGSTRAYSN
jgi:thiol:disulfide interchange protein